jgi:hypothetical protein
LVGGEEAAFLRGEVGVDGQATEEARDEAEVERAKALEAMSRGRAWLGREFLTWLLWRSNAGAPLAAVEGEDVTVLFVGPVVLQGLAGDATELRAKGYQSAYADIVREALGRGLLVHQGRLRLQHGEEVYEVTLDAERLAFRSARLPKLLTKEADDRYLERMALLNRLSALVDALWTAFTEVRQGPEWSEREVPGLRRWIEED